MTRSSDIYEHHDNDHHSHTYDNGARTLTHTHDGGAAPHALLDHVPDTEPDPFPFISQADWLAKGIALFGKDPAGWRFRCPRCGNEASGADFAAAGADPNLAVNQCIGRALHPDDSDPWWDEVRSTHRMKPCDWLAYGLITMPGTTMVVMPDTARPSPAFPFAEATAELGRLLAEHEAEHGTITTEEVEALPWIE